MLLLNCAHPESDLGSSYTLSFYRAVCVVGFLSAIAVTGGTSLGSGTPSSFKNVFLEPVSAFTLDYEQMTFGADRSTNGVVQRIRKPDGRELILVSQPSKQFAAVGQSNAFMLVQMAQKIHIPASKGSPPVPVTPTYGCGYYEEHGWLRSDASIVQLINRESRLSNDIKRFSEILAHEEEVWSIFFFGLPRLVPASAKWEGSRLIAKTHGGGNLVAEFVIDAATGIVRGADYEVTGNVPGTGRIDYSHLTAKGWPSVFEKRVTSASDPYAAARGSTKIRIQKRVPLVFPLSEDELDAPLREAKVAISNGIPLLRSAVDFTP